MLYHVDFRIEYPASMSQKDLFSIWAREADGALEAKKAGVIIELWKCVGSRRVIAVVNVDSPDTLDQILLDLPIMQEHGQRRPLKAPLAMARRPMRSTPNMAMRS
jgi:muconolactone delta-isomerase